MSAAPLDGKVALVTGGTGGIGRETALGLAKLGATVVVVGRDRARGEQAVEAIRCQSGNERVELITADLSSLDQVRWVAERFGAMHPRLDILVNNAAGAFAERTETTDGFEATLALTHLSPALLTHLLLPRLRASVPARIVNVGSGLHRWATMRWDDLQSTGGYRGLEAYGRAKLLSLMWTYELARRLRGTGITVVAADPGSAWTPMAAAMVPSMAPVSLRLAWPLLRRLQRRRTPAAAARSSVVAATSRELVSGAWVDPRGTAARSSTASHDGEAALRAWETTAKLLDVPLEQFAAVRTARKAAAPQKAAVHSRIPRSGWAPAVYRDDSAVAEEATAAA
ncbi:SDR family NAD(P)-dependent oxidoreductase [Longimicrobium sp.]|uniref:SDR family NAD(P)-dependent oxidoreductase n=1 Tax=Longimicrobium sp. TaxID=2029185 RepID=UPI003B3A32F9